MEVRQESLSGVQGGAVQAYLVRNANEQVSEGEIAGLCPLREHEVARQERLRRHRGQAVSSEADVEGAGPGRRGLRNHSNGEEDRLAKSYLGDISEGIPRAGLHVFGRRERDRFCCVLFW